MTYKKTSPHIKQKIRFYLPVALLIVIISLVNYPTIHAVDTSSDESSIKDIKESKEKNNALLISTEAPDMSAEKDFDKIRSYQSYDPITKAWSAIEEFNEVELLEDATQHHDENYIYYSFWAYDPVNHQWKRVDIREYGYKFASDSSNSDQPITKKPKKKFEFWKNIGLTFATGGGLTYYVNTINNLNLLVRNGQREYFLQPPGSADEAQGKAYKIRWFNLDLLKMNGLHHHNLVTSKKSFTTIQDNSNFHGIGFNIPISLGFHYTFFKKLRIGAGSNLEINHLTKLTLQGADADIMEYELTDPWFYNWKWFGTIAYKVFQKGNHGIVVDTQLGVVWDYGETLNPFGEYLYIDFYGSLGGAHEIRLNDFCKFFYRLSAQYKRYHNDSDFASISDTKDSTSSIALWQPAIHLEIGTIFNFGRDKDTEEEEEDTDSDKPGELTNPRETTFGSGSSITTADPSKSSQKADDASEESNNSK